MAPHTGIIMGYPTTISMNLGMITGWAILSPLAKHKGWAPGPVSSSTDGSRGWIVSRNARSETFADLKCLSHQLWVSLAIMISESVISLLPIAISYSESIAARIQQARASQASARPEEDEVEPPERLVPLSWVSVGLAVSTVAGIVLVWVIFGNEGIRPWATALGLVLASILSVLGVRALGQTDLNPVVSLHFLGLTFPSPTMLPVVWNRQNQSTRIRRPPTRKRRRQHHCRRSGRGMWAAI